MNLDIVCFNIHKGVGWGVHKSTIHRIKHQIHESHADIILLQEVRGAQFEFLASELWPHFSYGRNAVYQKGHHGNAILSKYPIIYSDNIDLSMTRYERRGLLHSMVQLPGHHRVLHLLCVHLGLLAKDRRKQLDIIVRYLENNISSSDPLILGGDFNDWRGYATKPLINHFGLQEAFKLCKNKYAKTYPAWAPVLQLDRVYFRGFSVVSANRMTKSPWRNLSDHIALNVLLNIE
ncbi:hypothetical protein AQUSIP_24610 [Aquicella siphonis]|uniref:Endonuclease/exonuclease/phosphatase domain-containing protein n=1 Tax=Aquicella siphonis TaxID=254247 RepID=A0A5E4PJJ1_9COXI|nr:endonuclease/exonuclease/phosphatase family protein [Aquicella siphonis]VVC77134.1 hypothetical protein AQUSIP_24610 [Aquicella siphonis]